ADAAESCEQQQQQQQREASDQTSPATESEASGGSAASSACAAAAAADPPAAADAAAKEDPATAAAAAAAGEPKASEEGAAASPEAAKEEAPKPRLGKHYRQITREALVSAAEGPEFVSAVDETQTVWISNIDSSVSEQQLQQLINSLTQGLTQLRLVRDFRGISKGFAYADFGSAAAAAAAAAALHGQQLNERPLKALRSQPTKRVYEDKTLFISCLPKRGLTEAAAKDLLLHSLGFRGVAAVRLVRGPDSSDENKGYGYVDFESHEAAVAALRRFHQAQQQQQQQQQQDHEQPGGEEAAQEHCSRAAGRSRSFICKEFKFQHRRRSSCCSLCPSCGPPRRDRHLQVCCCCCCCCCCCFGWAGAEWAAAAAAAATGQRKDLTLLLLRVLLLGHKTE
ncbi:poly(a) binding protein, putative, partial [Eimeria tenella]